MGSAAYLSRVAGIAVALGVGAAVTTGTGTAYANDDEPSTPVSASDDAPQPDPVDPTDPDDAEDENVESEDDEGDTGNDGDDGEEDQESDDVVDGNVNDDEIDGEDGELEDAELGDGELGDGDQDAGAEGDDQADGDLELDGDQGPDSFDNSTALRGPAVETFQTEGLIEQSTGQHRLTAAAFAAPLPQPQTLTADAVSVFEPLAAVIAAAQTNVAQLVQQQVQPADIVASFIAAVGISPWLGTTPTVPAPSPVLWAVLAWVRRQFEQTLLNDTPTIAYQPGSEEPAAPGVVTGNLNVDDADLAADELDRLTYSHIGVDDGATLDIDGDGSFTYTAPPGSTGYTDTFTVTVSDAATGPHLHGLLGFLQPSGGHTASQTITVTVPAAEEENVVVIEGSRPLQPGATVIVAEGAGPKYGDLEYEYNPATGEFTYTYTMDLIDQLRAGAAPTQPQPLARGAAFSALAAGDVEDSFVVTVVDAEGQTSEVIITVPIPTKHFEVDGDIDAGPTPIRVVFVGDYAYVMNVDQTPPNFPGSVRAIYVGELDEGQEPPEPVDIEVGNIPQWIANDEDHLYVSSVDGVRVIDTASNEVVDVIVTEGRPVFLHAQDGLLYVGDVDMSNQFGPHKVSVLDVSDPASPSYGEPVMDPIEVDGIPYGLTVVDDELYVVTVSYVQDPVSGSYSQVTSISVFDVDTGEPVDSIPLERLTTTLWPDETGRYLYVPGISSFSAPGTMSIYDTETGEFVDTDPTTDGVQPIALDTPPTNIVFDEDNGIAYIGRYGDTVSVIDTTTYEEITTIRVPGDAEFQGLIVSEGPDGAVWVTDPLNSRLFVVRLVDGPVPPEEIV